MNMWKLRKRLRPVLRMLFFYKPRHMYKITVLIGIFITFSAFSTTEVSNIEPSRLFRENILGKAAENVRNFVQKNAAPARNNAILQNLSRPLFQFLEVEDYFMDNETNYFRLSETRMSQVPGKFSIQGSSICRSDDVDLLIFMMSVAKKEAAAHRLKIRETWASSLYDSAWQQTTRARLVFFFSDEDLNMEQRKALGNESKIYNDIAVGQFHDSYANLSLKMVAGLTWVISNCRQVRHLAKIDMDTYVNIPVLLELVETVSDNFTEYVLGYKHMFRRPVVVRKINRWTVSDKVYPLKYFPRYIYGHSYVISGPALGRMVKGFPYFQIVPNEDAFITGIIPKVLNITRLKSSSFPFLFKKPRPTFCDLARNGHAASLYRPSNLDEMWRSVKTGKCLNISIRDTLPSNYSAALLNKLQEASQIGLF